MIFHCRKGLGETAAQKLMNAAVLIEKDVDPPPFRGKAER